MSVLSSLYNVYHTYGSDLQTGAVVVSALAAYGLIISGRKTALKRGTLDLILHQESDRELVDARIQFNKIKAGDIRPSTYGKPDKRGTPEAEAIRSVLNIHELTAVAISEGVIDECVYRQWFNNTFIADYETTKDYIIEMRKTFDNPKGFCEFEQTAIRWKEDKDWGAPPGWLKRKIRAFKRLLSA